MISIVARFPVFICSLCQRKTSYTAEDKGIRRICNNCKGGGVWKEQRRRYQRNYSKQNPHRIEASQSRYLEKHPERWRPVSLDAEYREIPSVPGGGVYDWVKRNLQEEDIRLLIAYSETLDIVNAAHEAGVSESAMQNAIVRVQKLAERTAAFQFF